LERLRYTNFVSPEQIWAAVTLLCVNVIAHNKSLPVPVPLAIISSYAYGRLILGRPMLLYCWELVFILCIVLGELTPTSLIVQKLEFCFWDLISPQAFCILASTFSPN
jgi:hypothetical protein